MMRKIPMIVALALVLVLLLSACGTSKSVSYTGSAATQRRSSRFTNQYGTPTTICAHPGCNNYIASSGDTNCCTTHSRRCAQCGKYIDEDATYCMDCLRGAFGK